MSTAESDMKITAMLPYFGGKRNMAAQIVEEIGPHKAYWEPFCGSLAVLFAKKRSSHETVNDLNGDVVNLARVLQSDHWFELHDRIERTLFCEALFEEAKEKLGQSIPDEVERAYWYLLVSWMGRSGVAGTRDTNTAFCLRFSTKGGCPGKRFRSMGDSLPAWHERLRGVWILRRDAISLIDRIDDLEGTAIYADPPYLEKSADYIHDLSDDDHARLATALRRFEKSRVVLSYYDHPRLAELYPDWTKLEVFTTKTLSVQNKKQGQRTIAPEVLLINGPSQASGGMWNLMEAEDPA